MIPELISGTVVRLKDGTEVTVETSWGQGKYRVFKLTNGNTINDLDKLVDSGDAEVVVTPSQGLAKDLDLEEDFLDDFEEDYGDDDGTDLQD